VARDSADHSTRPAPTWAALESAGVSSVRQDGEDRRGRPRFRTGFASRSRDRTQPPDRRRRTNLASAYGNSGRPAEAINYFQQALTLAEEIGDQDVAAAATSGLCCAQQELDDHDQAVHQGEQALTLARKIEDRHGELVALSNLGRSYTFLGKDRAQAGVAKATNATMSTQGR